MILATAIVLLALAPVAAYHGSSRILTSASRRPKMGGWLDNLADNILGPPAEGINDGSAPEFANKDEAAMALEEATAANNLDGHALRAIIIGKWGKEYDVEFTVTDYLGKSSVYLNVFPWSSDSTPWRHEDEALGTW